jgi:hypothetical protein
MGCWGLRGATSHRAYRGRKARRTLHSGSADNEEVAVIDVARGLAALVAALALVWLAPGLGPPAAAQAAGAVEEIREEEYDGCTFRLVNRYSAEDGVQQALTRQVRTEDCRFGARNRTIRVRVCFEGPEDETPVDCSPWLSPTADTPYAESEITSLVPKGSIHYVEIRGEIKSFASPPPELPPEPTTPPPDRTPAAPPPTTPAPAAPTPTATATSEPSPAAEQGLGNAETQQPELRAAEPPRSETRYGLAAALAAGGVALLGLGGSTIWLLRRGGLGAGVG